jgi:hypothetical protein
MVPSGPNVVLIMGITAALTLLGTMWLVPWFQHRNIWPAALAKKGLGILSDTILPAAMHPLANSKDVGLTS